MKRLKVDIAHPGRQHSHQVALALQEGGMLERYLTSIWYLPDRFPYAVVDWLPVKIKNNVLRRLKKRSFEPLDLKRIETYPFWKTLSTSLGRFNPRRAATERQIHKLNREFDRWVAQKLTRIECDLLIGYETAALESFRVCKKKDIVCVLDLAAIHWRSQERVFAEGTKSGDPLIRIEPDLLEEIQEIKEKELLLADCILTPSSYAKESLVKNGIDEQKIIQIPYGVDISQFQVKKQYKRDGRFTALYVGAITPWKGLKYLLEAFQQLKLPDTELLLIGGMAGGEALLKKYKGTYTYFPFLPHKELTRFYQEADLFVFPSLLDSFGMVVIEAMACGTPVIVSEHTGAKDAVRNGMDGYIVPIRDVEGLKQRILYLYQNRDQIEYMGRNARKQAEKYSWEIYRERIRQIATKISSGQKDKVALCSPV